MRLYKFQIKNYKILADIEFSWDDIIILIGENNTGKSSILEALDWFLSNKQISNQELFRNKKTDKSQAIELIGTFDQLSDTDRNQQAIRARIYEEKWILKKKYWINTENDKAESEYFTFGEIETFKDWPENDKSWTNFPDCYSEIIEQHKSELGSRATNDAKDQLKEIVKSNKPELIELKLDWIPHPGGWRTIANSILPKYILVPAVYDAKAESKSKDRQSMTTYGEVLNLVLEKKLSQREEIKDLNKAIAKVKALFRPDLENPDWQQDFEEDLSKLLSRVIESKAKLNPQEIPFEDILLPNTELRLYDGIETKIEGQGHGLQRTLIMSLLQVLVDYENLPTIESEDEMESQEGNDTQFNFQKSVIFAVEEPELYMHPQIERKVRDTLYDLARADNYQVVCSTHSPVFVDMAEKHTAIVRLEMKDDRRIIKKQVTQEIFTGSNATEQKKRLRMITSFDPAVNELFFAKRVVLVEGDTEIAVFQKAAELMRLFEQNPHAKRDITFINCHGKWTMVLFLEILNHFEVNYLVFHDEDRSKPAAVLANDKIGELVEPPNARIMFSPEDIESILGYDASTKDKPIKALNKLEELAGSNSIPDVFKEHVKTAWGIE